MLQLESENLLIKKTLRELIDEPQLVDRIISDFDYTTYHLSTPESKSKLLFSINTKCYQDVEQYGLSEKLSKIYGEFEVAGTTEPGFNYSIYLDLEELGKKSAEEQDSIIKEVSLLKRNILAAPFEDAFAEYEKLSAKYAETGIEPDSNLNFEIKYREEESIFIKPKFDRVTVIFSTIFKDETDKIFGKVFLQEFVDARRRAVQNAPQVLYSHKEPPLEIKDLVANSGDENVGYITFVLFPRHLTVQKRYNTISHIQLFRNYFHYHIKCSKAYMHSRMRLRVSEYLKVLNRAKPENQEVERKTATGRRFDR